MKFVELADASETLLDQVLVQLEGKGQQSDFHLAFAFRIGRNLQELSEDYRILESEGRNFASPVILRAIVEGKYKLGAASVNKSYPAEQSLFELNQLDKKDKAAARKLGKSTVMEDGIQDRLSALKKGLAETYGVDPRGKKWTVKETAVECDQLFDYDDTYDWLCRSTHGDQTGLMISEHGGMLGYRLKNYTVSIALSAVYLAHIFSNRNIEDIKKEAARIIDEVVKEDAAYAALSEDEYEVLRFACES